jgi:integral membrane protein (TIGR01906 family)
MPRIVVRLIALVLTWLVPVLLVLVSVRILMTPAYLNLAYDRPGFPPDRYGWPDGVREQYGPYGVRYLTNDADISYLADLDIEGEPAFTRDELRHMEDVKVVTKAAFRVLWVSGLFFVFGTALLLIPKETRPDWLRAIRRGGMQTLVIFAVLVLILLISWDFYFDSFHAMFFDAGSWQFYNDDTLIRLYPQQFWFDASLVIITMTIIGALLCIVLPRRWLRVQNE